MTHVLVETNWVVAYAAPAHACVREAVALAQKAASGEVRLYVPSVCLSEARYPIRTKFHPRRPAEAVRNYMAWAIAEGAVSAEEGIVARRVLDRYETSILTELAGIEVGSVCCRPVLELKSFPSVKRCCVGPWIFTTQNLDLKPFDQAILAAVLVRGEALRAESADEVSFCELDSDLQLGIRTGGPRNRSLACTILRGSGSTATSTGPARPGGPAFLGNSKAAATRD